MIQKVMPKLTVNRVPKRALLQTASGLGLMSLAGSSMSGANPPIICMKPTEMIIPEGLNFKEKAYYLLTNKLPKSVYKRWKPKTDEYVPKDGDQVVKINMDERLVGDIIEPPHDVDMTSPYDAISKDIVDSNKFFGEVVDNEPMDFGADLDGDSGMSLYEIWEHLAGM